MQRRDCVVKWQRVNRVKIGESRLGGKMLGLILIHVSAYLVLLCAYSLDGSRVMFAGEALVVHKGGEMLGGRVMRRAWRDAHDAVRYGKVARSGTR